MPRFRLQNSPVSASAVPPSLADVRALVADAVRPGHFFVGPATHLEWDHVAAEDVSWEVFRGRLLDPAHTRQRRTFESWNVYLIVDGVRAPEPLLSVKLDAAARQVHVVRAIHCYAWEGYDAGGNVILSRETKKWVRELVGTIDLANFTSADDLLDEIICRLFQAVVGTSRLPLTSVEAPLPAFTFGELAYFYGLSAGSEPARSHKLLWERVLSATPREAAKSLEFFLRAMSPDGMQKFLLDAPFLDSFQADSFRLSLPLLSQLRTVFNEVSLSPFTDLPDKALRLACRLTAGVGYEAQQADFLTHLLRQIGRHLTAYDLVRFHHAGANYPDALLLDAVLRECLDLIERRPALFLDADQDDEGARRAKRLRRRGLRQAWLIRQRYRGHPVPDAPTSPGENARVLPTPHARIPEEQILQPHRRTKQLFTEEAPGGVMSEAVRAVLQASIVDLRQPDELRDLGMALYLDRPLGAFKAPGEPDQTPLLSYEAFSRSIAIQRLLLLGRKPSFISDDELLNLRDSLRTLPVAGLPVSQVPAVQRPGVVSLADARKAADDFILLRTTNSSLREFFDLFDFTLAGAVPPPPLLLVGGPATDGSGEIILTICEVGSLRKLLELSANPREGYVVRAGVEYPRQGLRARRV